MTSTDATITVTVRPHWVNGWFLRPLARPVVQLDGEDHVWRWGRPLPLTVPPGPHRLRACFRYRGFRSNLGTTAREVTVEAGDTWTFVARHGFTNRSGLRFVRVARA